MEGLEIEGSEQMKNNFYEEEKHFYIYAVLDLIEECVFVGKTASKDPRSRYRAHLRGEVKSTRDDFGIGDPSGGFIDFRILESLECTEAEAYKHVIAWGHFFEENGCILLMSLKTVNDCENFLPETKAIYERVCAPITLEQVWRREVPIVKDPEPEGEYPLKQINIRLRADVMEWFRTFCCEEHLTQSEGLHQLLLSRQEQLKDRKEDMFVRELRKRNRRIQELEEENKRLKERRQEKSTALRQQRDNWIEMVRQLVRHVLGEKDNSEEVTRRLAPQYRYYKIKDWLSLRTYPYPKESGSCIMILEMFVRGDGNRAPLFILGHTPDGEKIRVRWYPKAEQVGLSPRSKRYTYEGAQWLIGYVQAKDGAMDLLALLPIERLQKKVDFSGKKETQKKSGLDMIIRDAQSRSGRI